MHRGSLSYINQRDQLRPLSSNADRALFVSIIQLFIVRARDRQLADPGATRLTDRLRDEGDQACAATPLTSRQTLNAHVLRRGTRWRRLGRGEGETGFGSVMHRKEALCLHRDLEPLHLPLSLPRRLMGVLRPVVQPLADLPSN
jgi:hypothetical protein